MQISSHVRKVAWMLSVALLAIAPLAAAEPNEEVAAAVSNWAQALGQDEPEKRQRINGKTQQRKNGECADKRHRDCL